MNRTCTGLTVIALFLTLPLTALGSNTWYVSGASGNDSNECKTPTTACKTIAHGILLASVGRFHRGRRRYLYRESHDQL
jgi:hypothetical protein